MASNVTSHLIILFFMAFNMLIITTGEMGVWDNSLQSYDMDAINNSLSSGVTDLTDVSDIESEDDIKIDYFQLAGLVGKSFVLFLAAVAMIPATGAVMAYYGVDLAICAIFELFNLLLVAYAIIKFTTNRSTST